MANEQKFKAFTERECSSQGSFRRVAESSTGSTVEKLLSSVGESSHTFSRWSRPCLETWHKSNLVHYDVSLRRNETPTEASCSETARRDMRGRDPRYYAILAPTFQAQNGSFMCTPDGSSSLRRKTPEDNPTVGVTGQETSVFPKKAHVVDMGGMSPENVGWLGSGLSQVLRPRFLRCCWGQSGPRSDRRHLQSRGWACSWWFCTCADRF